MYSNVASSILGFAVEAATNMTYDAYVQQTIFDPLGMTDTTISHGPEDRSKGFIPQGDIWFGASLGYEDM